MNAIIGVADMKSNNVNWKQVIIDVVVIWFITSVGSILALGIRRIPYVSDHWLPVKTALGAVWTLIGFIVAGFIGSQTKSKRMHTLSVAGVIIWLFGLINLLIFPTKMIIMWLIVQAVVIGISVFLGTAISLRITPPPAQTEESGNKGKPRQRN